MVYFVTGIDTGIGKTFATGLMARYLRERGFRVITQKLVQTGNVGYSEDLDMHRRLMGTGPLPEDEEGWTRPAIFSFPASPHLAAELDGRTLDLEAIADATRRLVERYEYVLVEGAGGPAVPLTRDLLTIDYVAEKEYPVILVTSGRLGSINHTLLALEAFARRGVWVCGLVYNHSGDEDPVIAADTRKVMLEALSDFGYPEVLVEIPEIGNPDCCPVPDCGALFTPEKKR